MSTETELKLSVAKSQRHTLMTLPFWKKFTTEPPKTFQLCNTYFDTLSKALNQAKVALRIRVREGSYYQTLKTRGESINGLSHRGEWEWPLEKPELDLDGLAKVWPGNLGSFPESELIPLFTTNFERTCWIVEWPEPKARVETALDVGTVTSGTLQSDICELELELIEGSEDALHSIASQLSQHITLEPANMSKAERGFELLNASQPPR